MSVRSFEHWVWGVHPGSPDTPIWIETRAAWDWNFQPLGPTNFLKINFRYDIVLSVVKIAESTIIMISTYDIWFPRISRGIRMRGNIFTRRLGVVIQGSKHYRGDKSYVTCIQVPEIFCMDTTALCVTFAKWAWTYVRLMHWCDILQYHSTVLSK